ncbi:MAG TPA: hypothetical protein PLH55_06425 [Spirochaetales bacterium]|nr:hypothetical protein [Spirochaetales bacterium]
MTDTKRRLLAAAAMTVVALFAGSCASVVRAPDDVEPERLLPAGATAYARLDGAALSAALAAMPGVDAKGASAIAERTDSMTLALVAAEDGTAGIVAVAEGRYPAGAASMRLSSDPSWRKDGPAWSTRDGGLHLAFASSGRAFVGTVPLDAVIAAAVEPNPMPVPARWSDDWAAPIAVYLPRPMDALRARLPLGDGAVPMGAIMLSARLASGQAAELGGYSASLAFEFDDERSAVVFAPICRLFLYVAANALWPERSATVLDSALWSSAGRIVRADGIPLDADAIAAFVTLGAR